MQVSGTSKLLAPAAQSVRDGTGKALIRPNQAVVLTMLHTEDYQPAAVAVPAAKRYCERLGYEFVHFRGVISKTRHPAWSKIYALLNVIDNCADNAVVIWSDADIILFGNRELHRLTPAGVDMSFSVDFNGLCSGFLVLRVCDWTRRLLAAVAVSHEEQFPWEQKVFKELLGERGERSARVGLIPESVIQNPYSPYCPAASGMHFWAHIGGHAAIVGHMQQIESSGWLAVGPSVTGQRPFDEPNGGLFDRLEVRV